MQMSRDQADRFLASKKKLADKAARLAKARRAAPAVDANLALEILKAQERAAERAKQRAANLKRIRG
jgi:hypothetical protein